MQPRAVDTASQIHVQQPGIVCSVAAHSLCLTALLRKAACCKLHAGRPACQAAAPQLLLPAASSLQEAATALAAGEALRRGHWRSAESGGMLRCAILRAISPGTQTLTWPGSRGAQCHLAAAVGAPALVRQLKEGGSLSQLSAGEQLTAGAVGGAGAGDQGCGLPVRCNQ